MKALGPQFRIVAIPLSLGILFSLNGCSQGEFRAEEIPSKASIQKQIDQVKASKDIPDAAKGRILAGLQQSMGRAKD